MSCQLVFVILQTIAFFHPIQSSLHNSEFDFVVIGGGSAGSVVASRLSEEDVQVLLLEAGGEEKAFYDDLPLGLKYQDLPDIYWDLSSESSSRYCLGMQSNSCNWIQGKVFGGGSVINEKAATRGNPEDYDRWSRMGNDGWSYRDVLKYFKKLENNTATDYQNYDAEVRGQDGPVTISFVPHETILTKAFLSAGEERGFKVMDYNGRNQVGFSPMQTNQKNARRVSSNTAYLKPARSRRNLILSGHSRVSRIDVDPKTMRAVGVSFLKSGKIMSVKARREIILSAGALHSPQLLMLSGIGPRKHLIDTSVPVVLDAPGVGQNLMDHVSFAGSNFLYDDSCESTSQLGREIAFVNIDDLAAREGFANVEFLFGEASMVLGEDSSFREFMKIRPEVLNGSFGTHVSERSFMIWPVLLKPQSRGEVLLRSNDINDDPRLVANYFDHKDDVRRMIEAMKETLALVETEAMRRCGARLVPGSVFGCESLTADKYWECAMRTLTVNLWHFSGTAKMGPRSDRMAVVDNRLRVHGIKGLRIVDASIMPEIPSGHTNIPTIMVAEKASDMIKEDWNLLKTE